MAKLFSPNVSKNFGEAFLSTVDRERKLRQQQQQFDQEMSFRNRQLNFLNAYREGLLGINQGNLDARNREQDFKEQPTAPKELQTSGARVGADGYIHRWNPNTKKYEKTNLKAPETNGGAGNGQGGVIQSPHISSIKLDEAYGQYRGYDDNYNKSLKEGESQKIIDAGGNQVELTKEQLRAGRDSHRKTFMIHADNRADALEKTYKGFEAFYNEFKDRKDLKGAISRGRLMHVISTDMAGFPADAIREMFELIVKTNG
jgi:hypothetical protein